MVKVSVIIPVYNTEKYLRKCLDSVCNQTLKDIEIICVNDCSPDNCLDILREYAENDNRIKIIDFTENKGAAAARNAGIEQAQGEYLGFVDSDDFIDLDFYEKLYNKAAETGADAVKGKLWLYDLETKTSYLEDWIDINDDVKIHKANFYFTFTTAIYKTSLIKKYDVRFLDGMVHFEDPYFTIKAALFYKRLEVVDSARYYYVNNQNSSSRNITLKHAQSIAKGTNLVVDLLNNRDVEKEHYLIVFNFVFKQLLEWCNKISGSDDIINITSKALANIWEKSKYKEECITFHFLEKKRSYKKNILSHLRKKIGNR